MKKVIFLAFWAMSHSILYAQNGSVLVDADNNSNGQIGTGAFQDALKLGGNFSGEGISSPRQSGSPNLNGLNFLTNFARRMSITQGGLVTLGSHGQNNNNANLEVQATGSNIALRVFPFTAVFNRSVSITGPMGRPGLQFNETGNVFDMRCHTNGFEFNKGGSGIGIGIRMLWDNFNGVAMEVGNSYNTSLIANYKLFVETGIRAALMSTDKLGVGTTNPSTSVDVNDNTANSEAVKVISNNKPRIMTISDNSAISGVPGINTGLQIQRTMNNNLSAAYLIGTKEVLRLQTDQVDNQTNATSLNAIAGAFRSSKSTGTYTAVNAWTKNADTSYGVKSESGDPFSCSNLSYAGHFRGYGKNAYGIYAEGIGCDASSNSWAAYLRGNTEMNAIAPNTSGLKFTQLTSNSPTFPANGKTLTVDASGRVILVDCCASSGSQYTAGTGISINNNIVTNTAPSKWNSNGNNISFGNSNNGNVGVGINTPSAKIHAFTTNQVVGIYSENNTSGFSKAFQGKATGLTGLGYGGEFQGSNTGVYGFADENLDLLTNNQSGSQFDLKGIHGFASDNGTSNSHDTKGVFGEGLSSNQYGTAYGVYGYGSNSNLNGGESIGLYGEADNSASSNDEWALYANGNTYALGSSWTGSDKRLKTNIQQISNALDIVRNLEAKTYEFRKDGKFATMHLPNGKNYGFLAQDLEKVIPEAVSEAPLFFKNEKNKAQTIEKYKAVNYTALIPILTQAIKEQQAQIEDLKNALAKQSSTQPNSTPQELVMDDKGLVATLTQNVPNPFTTDTRISYTIPFQYQSAKIGVYDLNGQELKLLTLNAPIGEVIIQGGKLKPGMYIYTLIVDGKTLSSKKMTLTSF